MTLRLVVVCRCLCRPELFVMNKGIQYILKNEMSTRVTMVHMHAPTSAQLDLDLFHSTVSLLNLQYPKLVICALAVSNFFASLFSQFSVLGSALFVRLSLPLLSYSCRLLSSPEWLSIFTAVLSKGYHAHSRNSGT